MAETLPEGTDQIKAGAASSAKSEAPIGSDASDLRTKAQAKAGEFRGMVIDHARDYADQGKEKASGALNDVAKLIDENATHLDDRLGSQFGDYARRASAFVADAADGLREKDVEDLLDDARGFVRRSPGIAIAAATAAGFLAARVVKAGNAPAPSPARSTPAARRGGASR